MYGSGVLAPLILNLGTLWRSVVKIKAPTAFLMEMNSATIWSGVLMGPVAVLDNLEQRKVLAECLLGFEFRVVKSRHKTNKKKKGKSLILKMSKRSEGFLHFFA